MDIIRKLVKSGLKGKDCDCRMALVEILGAIDDEERECFDNGMSACARHFKDYVEASEAPYGLIRIGGRHGVVLFNSNGVFGVEGSALTLSEAKCRLGL